MYNLSEMLKGKLFFKILLNSLLGLVLIFVWSRFVNLNILWQIIKTVDLRVIILFIALFTLSGVLRTWRFKLLLKKYPFSLKNLLMLNFLSQFLSFMIPVRAGEISKSVYLTSQHDLPLAKTMVWVFIDRFLDFWVVILFINSLLFFIPTNLPAKGKLLIFILLLFFSLCFLLALVSEVLLKKSINFMSHLLIHSSIKRWIVIFTHNIIEGFLVLRLPLIELGSLLGLTVLATIIDALVWFFIFQSLGVRISFAQSLLGNCLSALSFIIPAAPGYVGSVEAAILGIFGGLLGMETNLVSAGAIIFHLLTLITILIFGLLSLYLLKFDLKLVWQKIRGHP